MTIPNETTPPRRVKRGWMNLRVVDIVDETPDTKTFIFADADEGGRPFDFTAGQYLTFRFDNIADKPIVRSYTMSGSPRQTDITLLTVKRLPQGIISNWFCDSVKKGDILRARGPIGKFCFFAGSDRPNLYMVAGGSGVTPFVSIIREYQDKLGQPGSPSSLHLLVAYRSAHDIICANELSEAGSFPNVKIHIAFTREDARERGYLYGRPDDEMLEDFFADQYGNLTVMTCGPTSLMSLVALHAKTHGVPDPFIKTESFEQ